MEDVVSHDQARLVRFLPSLTELTVWLRPHSDVNQTSPFMWLLHHQHDSVMVIVGPALKTLPGRVRLLNIQSDFRYNGHGMTRTIKLPGFHQLRSLTVAMEHLGDPNKIRFQRSDGSLVKGDPGKTSTPCLPSTLKSLHLISCTRSVFSLLCLLDSFLPGELHLTHVTLAFDMPTISAIIWCGASYKKLEPLSTKEQRWLRRLVSLAQKHLRVEFFTTSPLSLFITELNAVAHLSDDEIAIVAGEGLQSSECVARRRDGWFRARSPAESTLFLLHGVKHRQLFCSFIFDFTRWTDTVFFHGNSGPDFEMHTDATACDEQKSNT